MQIQTNFGSLQSAGQYGPSQQMQNALGSAFSLQNAMNNKMEKTGKMQTPVTDHIAERVGFARQDRAAQQGRDKDMLDKMMSNEEIDQDTYDRAMVGVTSGNRSLMTEALKTPKAAKPDKPNLSNAEELGLIQKPFMEQRGQAERELNRLQKISEDKVERALMPDVDAKIKKQQDLIDTLYTQEGAAVDKWRTQGRGMYEPPIEPGTISMNRTAAPGDQAIVDQAKQLAGPEAAGKIGSYAGPVDTGLATVPPAAPAATPPAGAKQAPDGRWVIPDPNRPGKYIQWTPD
jgi:hypothetical protein